MNKVWALFSWPRAELIRNFSWQHRIFLLAQLSIALWGVYLWNHLPSPGWAVAILAAVAAAMSVHGNMHGWQKALWMILIGLLLIIELRAINKERVDSNAKALADRQQQDSAFKSVRDKQDADFQATATDLKIAISGIQSTLEAANTTIIQTRPHAAIKFEKVEFANGPPNPFQTNTPYDFNYHYVNSGTETATGVKVLIKLFVAKPDDKQAQIELTHQFEQSWQAEGEKQRAFTLVPSDPHFGTTERAFTDQELSPDGTIYYLLRFEYSDGAGRWRTDACGAFQRSSTTVLDVNIFHPCYVFQRFRYPAPRGAAHPDADKAP